MTSDRLKRYTEQCLKNHLYRTARFYSDKLVSLRPDDKECVLLLAQSFLSCGQPRRAENLIRTKKLIQEVAKSNTSTKNNLAFRVVRLYVSCLINLGDFQRAGEVVEKLLGDDDERILESALTMARIQEDNNIEEPNIVACICMLAHEVFDRLNQVEKSIRWLQLSVKCDPKKIDSNTFFHNTPKPKTSNYYD
eukprot:TRINITY_DN7200_c0_g1_i1.p1 TRINITY_DN7200_c0_g1~~TRINITY_DN7200_c0_g1_i1.p1  ORF type:complete len:193 (+),score=28.82 TRINITY_DN7200_c0_g1_i1:7-585(+)